MKKKTQKIYLRDKPGPAIWIPGVDDGLNNIVFALAGD